MKPPLKTLLFVGISLANDDNSKFLLALKTAHTLHTPPTLYLEPWGRYGRFDVEWDALAQEWVPKPLDPSTRTTLDTILEAGYQFYKDSLCGACGIPYWYGHSEHSEVAFEVETRTCYACAEVEGFKKGREPGYGETPFPRLVPLRYEETGLEYPIPNPLDALAKVP